MANYILEFWGTLVLVLFGDGVCCACSLFVIPTCWGTSAGLLPITFHY